MEARIPDWLTVDFLKQSLQSDVRYKDITISHFTASLAAPAGNNYSNLVIRVIVDYKLRDDEQKLSVIVKGPITEGAMGELAKELKVIEPLFYKQFLPELEKLMEYRFAPNTFHSPIPSVLVMEDLNKTGYVLADRIKQLDYEHCSLYMKAGAAFHAASAALYRTNPEVINSVCGDKLYCEESKVRQIAESIQKWSLECMANHISDKHISTIVRDCSEYIWRMHIDIHHPDEHFNSLIQFDPWTSNMLFKYDKQGNVCDVKLIDFQNPFYGSPVHDLVFFIWVSANDDVRKHRLHNLYQIYFSQLNMNLKKFNCPEIEFDSFMGTIKKFSPFILTTAAYVAVLLDTSPADMNELLVKSADDDAAAGTNPLERHYTEDFCQTRLPQLVDHLAAEGVFDDLADKLKSMRDDSS